MPKPIGPYGRLARFVLARRGPVALALAVLTLVAVFVGLPPAVNSNILALLPDDDPASRALTELYEKEGGANLVTLAFEGDDPVALDAFLDRVTSGLEALDTIEFAIHEVDEALAFRLGLLQLDAREVNELNVRLKAALALGPALNPIVAQRLVDMGPVTARIAEAGEAGLLVNEAGKGRVLARPTGSSSDAVFAERVMNQIEVVIAEADPEAHGVTLRWRGGAYHHVVQDIRGIKRDIAVTSLASSVLVLLCIMVAFRSVRATVLVFLPLLVANVWNLALVALTIGALNTYTSFGTAILVGLGIDFSVHLLMRYREYRAHGHAVEDAISQAWDRTGPPCTTAALTSAAGFLALSVARFQGFAQLGMLLAMGLIVCLGMTLIVLPLLIPWLDPDPKPLLPSRRWATRPSRSTYRLAPVGLMVVVLATALAGATRLPRIGFQADISELRRDGLSYAELTDEERDFARESFAPVVVNWPTREALAQGHDRIEGMIERGELPHVGQVVSVETISPSDQGARLTALAELARLSEHPNLRYLPPPIAKPLVKLRGFRAEPISPSDVPEGLSALVGASSDDHRMLLLPKGNMWDLRESAALMDELEGVVPGTPAGEYIAQGSLYRMVMRDIPVIGVLALFLVSALAAIDLRKLHWTAGAIGTLLSGIVWAGVVLQLAGVELSILNVVGIPILIGIGVDVVIHLLHRLAEEGPGGVRRALNTTGVAATVSTITTVLSFTSLLLAGSKGVRSLGLLVALGLFTVFVVSAALLPLAWAAGWRVTGRAPGDHKRRREEAENL